MNKTTAAVLSFLAGLVATVALAQPAAADEAQGWKALTESAWQPCATITYSTDLLPPDPSLPVRKYIRKKARFARTLSALRWAMDQVEAQTGLTFQQVSATQPAMLPIQYKVHSADPRFKTEAQAYAGPVDFTFTTDEAGENMRSWFSKATMVVDRSAMLSSPRYVQRVINLHELGHVVGLDHVDTPAGVEVMGTYAGNTDTRNYAPGDLLGLHTLYPEYATC